MKKITTLLLFSAIGFFAVAQQYPFQNTELSDDDRITDVISRLTLDEKIMCLGSNTEVERLGIKGHRSVEALHGLVVSSPSHPSKSVSCSTVFPQSYGLGQTWDEDLMQRIGEYIAYENRYIFQHDTIGKSGLLVWTPNMDLGRDVRWGRTEECFGEDPFLVGKMGTAMIRGLQGDNNKYWKSATLMKHFLANSNEFSRTWSSSNFSDKLFREYYSWGFMKGITEGGSHAFMTAYNDYNGIGCIMHPVLREIVMKEWGLKGIIISDGGAFTQFVKNHQEKYADSPLAAADCLKAGLTKFLDKWIDDVKAALERNLITETDIDSALRGNFFISLKLGLLDGENSDNPYAKIGRQGEPIPWRQESAKALCLEATQKGIVLLKNQGGLLPIDKKKVKKIAVIGEKATEVISDWYGGTPEYTVNVLEAIKEEAGKDIEVRYVRKNEDDSAVVAARWADIAIVCVGNHPWCNTNDWGRADIVSEGREAVDRFSITLDHEDMVLRVHQSNPNTVCVLISSFPYAINRINESLPAILHSVQTSQELGHGISDVLFGKYNPSGRLTQTWPKSILDIPDLLDYDITGKSDPLGRGRTYMYSKAEPLYPFGYGLSYTTFEYKDLKSKNANGLVTISVNVKNTGEYDGEDVVQVFVDGEKNGPIKRLKGFTRVKTKKGETIKAEIKIPVSDLQIWSEEDGKFVLPSEKVVFRVGNMKTEVKL